MPDLFERCKAIAIEIDGGNESKAREELILLLDECKKNSISYTPFLNHLIRQLGLFPYMEGDAIWQDSVAKKFFEADIGTPEPAVLHIDQSHILRSLLEGKDLLVSAPTSFGKSFVIDAFIASKKPNNVVIILPTVALTDETRRRLLKKFGNQYNIITQHDEEIKERNLFIFPQERAFSYLGKFPDIDILIVDEFYKASSTIHDDRYASLVKIIIELKKLANQCYFIAPDFELEPDAYPLTKGMILRQINSFTVCTNFHHYYKEISESPNKSEKKRNKLIEILNRKEKCLIYANNPKNINEVSNIVNDKLSEVHNPLLNLFSSYIIEQYGIEYKLSDLVLRGVGIHNGKIHRPLAQLQIKLFSSPQGLSTIVSSSSIIEGVNTSAENVVLWSNKIFKRFLDPYSYNNIIGRAGRMFKYFVGHIYLLEAPPEIIKPQPLSLEYTDEVISSIEVCDREYELTKEQIAKIKSREIAFNNRWRPSLYNELRLSLKGHLFNIEKINEILSEITENTNTWNEYNLKSFLEKDTSKWCREIILSAAKIENMRPYYTFEMLQSLSKNWELSIPEIIGKMPPKLRDMESYFHFERQIAYKLPNVLSLCVTIYNCYNKSDIDISECLSKISNAFLPKLVYQLEEYGLPRSLSKKIVNSGLIELDNPNMTLAGAIERFKEIGRNKLSESIPGKHAFEDYILEHFYSGI